MNWLLAPFQNSFMQTGALAILLIGSTCAILGVYVVLRRMAFIGDALAHTTLPGLVVAYINKWDLFSGALVAGLLTALGIGWLTRREEVREDTAIGILFTGMFALGVTLMSFANSYNDLSHLLFGNILAVQASDLWGMASITLIVAICLWLFNKELQLTSYDPIYAEVIGLRAEWVRYGLLILLALTVVSGIQAIGVVLTSALMITPAATAGLLTNRLPRMIALSVFFAILAGISGLYISYYFRVPSGPAIVLMCSLYFILAWVARRFLRKPSLSRAEQRANHQPR